MAYQSTDLTTLLARLTERVDGQVWWTSDQARRAINEGLRIWSLITGMWQTAVPLTTIPNDPYLFVSGTMTKGTRVSMGSRRLVQSSLFAFDHGLNNWQGTNTATPGAPPAPVYWAPVGLTEIAIYPADATVLGSSITVDGIRAATILVNAGDFLDLGDEEINSLLGYALHVLSFYKGMAALQATRPLVVEFFKAAAKRNAVFAASDLYRKITGIDRTRFMKPMEAESAQSAAALQQVGAGDQV